MARTRSTRAHEAVMNAALELIATRGIDATSMDSIAEASGVSKATIYKHWSTKEALCLEAIGTVDGDLPSFDTGNPRTDLVNLLRRISQKRNPGLAARLWPRVIGHAAGNPAFGAALKARFEDPRRAQVTYLVKTAIAQGELRGDVDLDIAPDILVGPVMHRCFVDLAAPPDLAERVVAAFWQSNARKSAG
jgi:AcrR family transcriptional regulator